MSAAISLVPAATTLHDMRSRGPPVDGEEDGHPGYVSLYVSFVQQLHRCVQAKRAHGRRWCPYKQPGNEAGCVGGMVTLDTYPALVGM